MTYVKINDTLYPAHISGRIEDKEWDNRETKSITVESDYETLNSLFQDGTAWSIVTEEINSETSETIQTEYDNSEFSVRGDLIVHTNGTCTVKMGKETDLEKAYLLLYGGV